MIWLAGLWCAWAILNVLLLLAVPYLGIKTAGPFTNGLQVVVPEGLAERVTPEEMKALLAHEQGHIAHRHNIRNLLLACFFIPRTAARHRRQEMEADAYAARHADAAALASALRKLSFNDFDWHRARLLDELAVSRPE